MCKDIFFGYIVSPTKYSDLTDKMYCLVKDLNECTLNIPKFIIGLEEAKSYAQSIGEKFDILNHQFKNGDMWTFKKTEKREIYEINLQQFKKYIIDRIKKKVKYVYIDIYSYRYSETKALYKKLMFGNGKKDNILLISGDMIYTQGKYNNVIGVSLKHLEFVGISKSKIIDKLKSRPQNKIFYSTSRQIIHLKKWFNDIEYVIPMILSDYTLPEMVNS